MIRIATIQGTTNQYEICADHRRLYCSCPAAEFKPSKDCKHLKKYKADNPEWEQNLDPKTDDDYEDDYRDMQLRAWKDAIREGDAETAEALWDELPEGWK